MNKIAFISTPGLENFMLPVEHELLNRGYEIDTVAVSDNQAIVEAVKNSEIVWIEWG